MAGGKFTRVASSPGSEVMWAGKGFQWTKGSEAQQPISRQLELQPGRRGENVDSLVIPHQIKHKFFVTVIISVLM